MLIFTMPFIYAFVVDNIEVEMMKIELKEIADYVSNTIENLYFLVNTTNVDEVALEKELMSLPSAIEAASFVVTIADEGGNATQITAYSTEKPLITVDSWLVPGLKVGAWKSVESGRPVVAGCSRNDTGVYAWIRYSS
jgi:hypothetical protein